MLNTNQPVSWRVFSLLFDPAEVDDFVKWSDILPTIPYELPAGGLTDVQFLDRLYRSESYSWGGELDGTQ